jgi:hypothetical protein
VGLQPVQADLLAESRVFAGRDAYLAELLGLLDPEASGTAPQVVVVSGMAGVGKSELVLPRLTPRSGTDGSRAACCLLRCTAMDLSSRSWRWTGS